MNIYKINIWGPCENADEAFDRRLGTPDNTAIVFAKTKDIANQVCYLVSTRKARFQSNYQEIDSYTQAIPCVLYADEEPFMFEEDFVNSLIAEQILPPLTIPDKQYQPGILYFARCTDDSGKCRGEFWAYAPDAEIANLLITEHGHDSFLFDLNTEAIKVELYPFEKTSVFWNADICQWTSSDGTASSEQSLTDKSQQVNPPHCPKEIVKALRKRGLRVNMTGPLGERMNNDLMMESWQGKHPKNKK